MSPPQHIQSSILDIINVKDLCNILPLHYFDIVYSIGLVDYFYDLVLEKFIRLNLTLLNKNGQIIIAACSNKNLCCYSALRWFCDWNFVVRDVKKTRKFLLQNIEKINIEIDWEKNKQIFFLKIKKD